MTQSKRSLAFSSRKRALLEQMLQAEGLAASPQPEKIPQQNATCVPLSFAQERLWFLEQLIPGTIVHNIHRAFRIFGALDLETLEKSCNEIIKRHAILRTTFTDSIPPTQKILPEWKLTIPLIDIQDFSEIEAETMRLATLEVQQPFDLEELPLWRVKLLQVAKAEYVLLITIHHLICDGWSFDVFCQELTQHYARSTGQPASLSELPIQYVDYAVWQRQWLQGEILDSQLNYWQKQLNGVEMLKLPTDGKPQTYRGIRQSLVIPQHLTSELKSLSQQQGVTLYMTLLAAWKVLLFQYTKQEDILICSPIAGRNRSETKAMIGCFNNLLPIRIHLSENLTFNELLTQVRQVTISAYEHQDLPFQQIANLASVPLSRAMFVLQNTPSYPLELPDIIVSPLLVHNGMANFDLSLFMEEKGIELFGEVEYKTDLFKATTINQIIEHFQILLASIIAHPQASLTNLTAPISPRKCLQVPQTESDVAQDELELQLTKIWEKVLGKKPIHHQDNFFELGGHSFLAIRLLAEITRLTGKSVPLDALLTAPTIERLTTMLRERGWTSPWTSLVPIQSHGSQIPFFCVHGAGGHVLNYYSLARQLGTDQPFYGLQAQGMDGKDAIHTTISEMAAHYIQEIRTIQPQGPYALGGFCMGGTIALEMAQQLTAAGEQVSLLALMYTFNFGQVPLSQLFPDTPKFIWEQLQCLRRNLALLPLSAKFTFLGERAKTAQNRLMSRVVAMRAMSSFTSLRSLQEKAAIEYIPKFYPGRVTIIRPRVSNFNESPEASWDGVFGDVEVKELPVYPGAMLLEPFVSDLATQLKACLQLNQEI